MFLKEKYLETKIKTKMQKCKIYSVIFMYGVRNFRSQEEKAVSKIVTIITNKT